MTSRTRIAAFAAAAFLSLPLGAADDPSLEQLAARASELVAANKLDEAEKLADQALEKNAEFAPALVQKARVELARGNESRESLTKANLILWHAVEKDPTYAPTYILMVHIQEKLGTRTIDPRQWFYRASKQRGNDEPWLVPYQLDRTTATAQTHSEPSTIMNGSFGPGAASALALSRTPRPQLSQTRPWMSPEGSSPQCPQNVFWGRGSATAGTRRRCGLTDPPSGAGVPRRPRPPCRSRCLQVWERRDATAAPRSCP